MEEKNEIKVVVIDLNKTAYLKSSKEEFYKFICTKRPWRLKYLFEMLYFKLLKNLNIIRQTEFKENFFNYLDELPPDKVASYAEAFWRNEYPKNFNPEILKRLEVASAEGQDIFCATGALEVYVEPLFKLFPVDGYAGTRTTYTGKTYKILGEACKGEEKINRLKAYYQDKNFQITQAYSDNQEELFDLAQEPFLVKDGKITPFIASEKEDL